MIDQNDTRVSMRRESRVNRLSRNLEALVDLVKIETDSPSSPE